MRIFTRKSFLFKNRETGASVKTQPLSFHDVPDWVEHDPIFTLAKQDKNIEIIETKAQEKELELNPTTETNEPENEASAKKSSAKK